MIPMVVPDIGNKEIKAAKEVLKSGQVAQGQKVQLFEKAFANYVGSQYGIATSSGTTALQIALLAHNIKSSDEVITTPFTFIATANSILSVGAKPVFVDINDDFTINADKIKEKITEKTKAIMPVHIFGTVCDMKKIMQIAQEHNLLVIEDAAQAHGAEFEGKKAGSFGTGAFSFYVTKNMTTIEGGMVTTNDQNYADNAKAIRNHGIVGDLHEVFGLNFRMTDLSAAIGIEQLKKLDKNNKKRLSNARYLNKKFKEANIQGIITPKVSKTDVVHQYTIRVTSDFKYSRDELAKLLNDKGISTKVFYPMPIPEQPVFKNQGYSSDGLDVCKQLCKEVLSLPVYPKLKKQELDTIVETIKTL